MSLMMLLPKLVRLSTVSGKCGSHKHWNLYTGHKVVRLPVAHCELNPIEMAWAQEYVRDHNQMFTLTEVERLVNEGFSSVTPERWKKLVNHVQQKIEDHYWEHEGLFETMIDRFTIHLGDTSDDSSSSSEDSMESCSSGEE